MGRQRQTIIKESVLELQEFKSSISNYKSSKKLDLLIAIKSGKFDTLSDVGTHLDLKPERLYRWLRSYRESGINSYLDKETRVNSSSAIITSEIHQGLYERLNDPQHSFLGFWDAKEWVEKTYDITISYQLLWHYMTHKLDAKLKIPRRSNIKKDPEATTAFLKTP